MKKKELQIEALTRAIEKLIATPVAPVLPVAPIAPVLPLAPIYTGDHDLLQRVDEKVSRLVLAVDGLVSRDNLFVLKDEFNFWRNLLVTGMLGTITISVLMKLFIK